MNTYIKIILLILIVISSIKFGNNLLQNIISDKTTLEKQFEKPIKVINPKSIQFTPKEINYLKEKKKINICIDPNWYPFESFDKNGKYIGISSEYFRIFEYQLNTKIEPIKTTSWSQTLKFAKNRKCDILTLANETPKRKKYLNFTASYLVVPFVMTTKNNIPFVNNFRYLKNKKIGVVKNSALEEILKSKYPNFILQEVKNNVEGIHKVQNNEIFGYVGNMLSVGYILNKNFISELKIINKLDNETSNLAIGVRNDDEVLFGIFQKLVLNIDENTKQNILHKYVNIKYEQNINYTLLFQIAVVFVLLIFISVLFLIVLRNKNKKLQEIQKELNNLNRSLESRVKYEIEKNEKQQSIVFQQRRLAQMGEMINMIAHQWRQPLSILSLGNQSIQIKFERGKLTQEFISNTINSSEEQISQMSKTIDDFKGFFKPEKEKKEFYINDVLDTSISLVKALLHNNNVDIKIKANQKIKLYGYPNELGQALINVLNNANDAFKNKQIKNKQININLKQNDENIILSIQDNACGIKDDIMDKIFDPYFSTKDKKNGTGIGLYMTKMIICNHMNAEIKVSNINDGVRFDFVFKN